MFWILETHIGIGKEKKIEFQKIEAKSFQDLVKLKEGLVKKFPDALFLLYKQVSL